MGFVTGATVANFVCLAAARGEVLRRVGWDVEADGLCGAPPINVLIGEDAHETVSSALRFLGLGHRRVIRVATDEAGAIVPAAFKEALAGCSGPTIAIVQAGQLNTGAFDPFAGIIPAAHARGAWVHVDGAFGLWARSCPEKARSGAWSGGGRFLGNGRTQVASDSLRLWLCDRARCRRSPEGNDHRRKLSPARCGQRT